MPQERQEEEKEFSFKSLFIPLTTLKVIHWIVIIGIVVYFNSLFNGFVWDDFRQIQQSNLIHSLGNFFQFFANSTYSASATGAGIYYRPLMTLSFSLIWSIFGAQPFFFHFFQVTIHIVNSILLFILFRKFVRAQLAVLLALIFLVHPINVEAVAYVSGLNDPLYFLFGISALILSLKEQIKMNRALVVSCLLLCSLSSKESGILFLFIIFAYHSIFRFKKSHLAKNILLVLAPFLMYVYLRFFVAKIFFQKISADTVPVMAANITERILAMPAIFLFYLRTFFFPKDLTIDQLWLIKQPDTAFYLPLFIDSIFLLGIILFGVWIYRKRKELFSFFLFFTLWFLGGLGFYMQLLPLDMTVAERWFYFPIVGLLGIIGIGFEALFPRTEKLKTIVVTSAFLIIALLALRTIVRNTDWYDNFTLYSHDSKIYDNFQIENNLGAMYALNEQYDEALKHFDKSNEIYPSASSLYNIGITYDRIGNKEKAREYFYKILDASDYSSISYASFLSRSSWRLLHHDSPENAEKFIIKALKKSPDNAFLWDYLAVCEYQLHNQQEALKAVQKARTILENRNTESLYEDILNNRPLDFTQENPEWDLNPLTSGQ